MIWITWLLTWAGVVCVANLTANYIYMLVGTGDLPSFLGGVLVPGCLMVIIAHFAERGPVSSTQWLWEYDPGQRAIIRCWLPCYMATICIMYAVGSSNSTSDVLNRLLLSLLVFFIWALIGVRMIPGEHKQMCPSSTAN